MATSTVTTYTYNPDGALTAVAVSVDGAAATTTYLTWDDFTPNAADPSTGTVAQGNGHLLGIGAVPGTAAADESFAFDRRERLTGYSGANGNETYDYHANGLMSSATTPSESFSFFYDRSDNARVTNIHGDAADLWSAYLGRVRYLGDGGEQALLMPRKDMACSYDPQMQSVQSYSYDAYGAPRGADSSVGELDLHDNPFRYAGEYRDPLWGGYYLRARWYLPQLQTFVSRDGLPLMNRYGYAGGNPVMRTDPSGQSYGGYLRVFGRPLGRFLAKLNKGTGGHFARLFLTPIIGPLQIIADPKAYWETLRHNKNGAAIFLVLGQASLEAFSFAEGAVVGNYFAQFFAARILTGFSLGTTQATVTAAARGFNHFDWNTFLDSEESVVGSIAEMNVLGGKGYNRFTKSGVEVAELVAKLEKAEPDTVLIVRQRTSLRLGPLGKSLSLPAKTSPLQEALGLGLYHERLLAISRNEIYATEVVDGILEQFPRGNKGLNDVQSELRAIVGKEFEVVGKAKNFNLRSGFEDIGKGSFWTARDQFLLSGDDENPQQNGYRMFRNNSHHHCAAVLQELKLE